MEIYLDSNVYLSVAQREHGYEYIIAKLNNLKKVGVIFPHAPPHAEEISARFSSQRGVDATLRTYNLIQRFNGGFGYLPGYPNKEETENFIKSIYGHSDLLDVVRIHKENLALINSGLISEEEFATRILKEDFEDCLKRVDKYLNLTEFAKQNDTFHLGRRNEKTLSSNFEQLNKPIEGLSTFQDIQKRYNLGPRRLSRIPPEEIFEDKFFLDFLRLNFSKDGIDFDQIQTGENLMKSHHKKELFITKILNCMEQAGYNQEEKNHEAAIVGRMHDVSHAIYATKADYLVTNDTRFFRKATATYKRLKLAVQVIKTEELLRV